MSCARHSPCHAHVQEPEAPGLLPEEDLVDRLKSIVPVGARNACRLAQSELVSFFVRHTCCFMPVIASHARHVCANSCGSCFMVHCLADFLFIFV